MFDIYKMEIFSAIFVSIIGTMYIERLLDGMNLRGLDFQLRVVMLLRDYI